MKTNIPNLRKKMQLTQEDLANIVGVTRQTIISIESGRYVASLGLAYKISKVFNLPIEQVFIFEGEKDE